MCVKVPLWGITFQYYWPLSSTSCSVAFDTMNHKILLGTLKNTMDVRAHCLMLSFLLVMPIAEYCHPWSAVNQAHSRMLRAPRIRLGASAIFIGPTKLLLQPCSASTTYSSTSMLMTLSSSLNSVCLMPFLSNMRWPSVTVSCPPVTAHLGQQTATTPGHRPPTCTIDQWRDIAQRALLE